MQKDLRRVEVQTSSDNKSKRLEGKFHGWGVTTDNSIAVTVAMVELSDGSIIYAVPHRIRFLDNGDGDVGQKHVVKPRKLYADLRGGCCAIYFEDRKDDTEGCHPDDDRNIAYSNRGAHVIDTHAADASPCGIYWTMDDEVQRIYKDMVDAYNEKKA